MNSASTIANGLLAISFLMNVVYVSGMEIEKQEIIIPPLPYDLALSIIHVNKPLEDVVKATLALRSTCRYFNANILPVEIGKSCKHYDIAEKNKVMEKLLCSMNDFNYWNKRQAAFLLTYAGADNQACGYYSLLCRAIHRKDKEMLIALFENNTDPNQRRSMHTEPDWFQIKDIDIAKMFITKGIDINAEGDRSHPNILWFTLLHNSLPKFIQFYLQNKVDVKKRNVDDWCILHKFVSCSWNCLAREDYIKIGELLCNAAPELINAKDKKGQTPLGLAYERLNRNNISKSEKKTFNAIIVLLEKHGGKRS